MHFFWILFWPKLDMVFNAALGKAIYLDYISLVLRPDFLLKFFLWATLLHDVCSLEKIFWEGSFTFYGDIISILLRYYFLAIIIIQVCIVASITHFDSFCSFKETKMFEFSVLFTSSMGIPLWYTGDVGIGKLLGKYSFQVSFELNCGQ